jgi:hypothetical protein
MNEKINNILICHKKNNPGCKIVKVTISRWYEIPPGTSTSDSEIIEEWFKKTPVSKCHAFRDNSLLIQCFNDDPTIV